MATADDFLISLYLDGGHSPSVAARLARRYLIEHGVPPAGLDASAVVFSEFGVPVVATPRSAALPAGAPATPAEAAAIAEASGGLVEQQEIGAYGLTPEEASSLANFRAAGVSGSAGLALFRQHARDELGRPFIDRSAYLVLHGFGLLGL